MAIDCLGYMSVGQCQTVNVWKPSGSVVPLVMFKELILPRKKFL